LEFNDTDRKKIGLVVGDVSGHGISSALLMATARAFIRLRSFLPGSIAQVLNDVNVQLARDLEDSGQFMTLFYLVIGPSHNCLRWVRAGHDPAILYDPDKDSFEELRGRGIALGVDENWRYKEEEKTDISKGQIIVIGTDGIWEASNMKGKMFGKDSLFKIIRQNSSASASEILDVVVNSVKNFQTGLAPEDDLTLVVVKI